MTTFEGKLSGKGLKVALIVGRFNELISNQLLQGAMDNLVRHDVAKADVDVAWVPGAFEMPLVAAKSRRQRRLRRRHLPGSGHPRRYATLGVRCRRGRQGYRQGEPGHRRAGRLRRAHDGLDRAGDRARRHQGRQQGLGGRHVGSGDGQPAAGPARRQEEGLNAPRPRRGESPAPRPVKEW